MPGEYRAIWNTPGGGTGYSVFHTTDMVSSSNAQAAANAIRAWFNTLVGLFPDEVSITFDTEVLELDVTGNLLAVYAVTPPAQVTGTQSTTYNRAAGIRVDWGTGVILSGRRLTGRTYLVPVSSGAFDANGLVTSATVSAIQAANSTLLTSLDLVGNLGVWSRTTKGAILTGRRD
jgi:hypothetical protein